MFKQLLTQVILHNTQLNVTHLLFPFLYTVFLLPIPLLYFSLCVSSLLSMLMLSVSTPGPVCDLFSLFHSSSSLLSRHYHLSHLVNQELLKKGILLLSVLNAPLSRWPTKKHIYMYVFFKCSLSPVCLTLHVSDSFDTDVCKCLSLMSCVCIGLLCALWHGNGPKYVIMFTQTTPLIACLNVQIQSFTLLNAWGEGLMNKCVWDSSHISAPQASNK